MKQGITILIGILMTLETFANVNFIDITKISNDSKYVTAFKFIKDNQEYYNHWTNNWSYVTPKEDLIKKLRDNYSTFSAITLKNTELLWVISHTTYTILTILLLLN